MIVLKNFCKFNFLAIMKALVRRIFFFKEGEKVNKQEVKGGDSSLRSE